MMKQANNSCELGEFDLAQGLFLDQDLHMTGRVLFAFNHGDLVLRVYCLGVYACAIRASTEKERLLMRVSQSKG